LRSDLVELCLKACSGSLDEADISWAPRASIGVVSASDGYPGSYEKGAVIHGLDAELGDDVKVFHAGTRMQNGDVVTSGGRVLCTVALGDTVSSARDLAYAALEHVGWEGAFFRRDIGYRAVAREQAQKDS
jgi:phosphoribosylamine--glycine ligase